MPDYLNEVHIVGTLSYEPEYKTVKDDLRLAKFSLVTSVGRRKTFVKFVAWAEVAEALEALLPGEGAYLEVWGKLKTSSWERDGRKIYGTDVVASEIKVLEGAGQEQEIPAESGAAKDRIQPDSPAPPPALTNSERDHECIGDLPF